MHSKELSSEQYVNDIWHFKVEDKLGWEFCAGFLKMNEYADISPEELEKRFKEYFKDNMGIAPYSPCPRCRKELLPRKSKYGYFVGCSGFPGCRFMATNEKPYVVEDNKND